MRRRTRQHFHAYLCAIGKQIYQPVNRRLAVFNRRCSRKPHKARFEIARIAKTYLFFAALVQREQLKIGGGVLEPSHSLDDCAPVSHQLFLARSEVICAVWWRQCHA